ncbi:DUF2059 domain-containing protein [Uliginosibacterium sp. 31-12]|uniref:DUF2059 domain-containing protein n=1 Tax=Uliginosibacterium sp. 31-12 TaxID=3062781 RepID=UPI0026E1319D|nr:DUF2059 domain-containing protein [Uliginosibacterium sp. 31-12]MDO6387343.1 DUF2059 domain-containing protein [Uliginosibacterium sp. 31-12]
MKRGLMLLLFWPVCVWADAASHRKAVDELMLVLRADGAVTTWRKQLDAQAIEVIDKALAGKKEDQLNEAQRAAVERFSQRANAALDAALDWSRFKDPIAQIYLENYSEGEVRDLLGFYRSASGQKALRQGGKIADAVGQLLRSQIQNTLPEFQRIGQDFNQEYEQAALAMRTPVPVKTQPPASSRPAAPAFEGVNPKTGR